METPLKKKTSSVEDFLKVKKEEDEGRIVSLPSGLQVKIKIPGMEELILSGAMTEELMDVAMRTGDTIKAKVQSEQSPEEKKKEDELFMKLCDSLVIASVVEPQITEGATDIEKGLISINDLILKDRMRIAMTVITAMSSKEGVVDRFREKKPRKISKK